MRERLNIRLAALVAALVVLFVVGTGLVHRWQVRRNASGLLALADSAETNGQKKRALWLIGLYLEQAPRDTETRIRYGILFESLAGENKKELAAVADVYERILAEDPTRVDIKLRLARLYTTGRRYNEALPHLNALNDPKTPTELKAPKEGGGDAEAAYLLGVCQEEGLNDTKKAADSYRASLELNPHFVDRFIRLALLLRRTGQTEEHKEADRIINDMVAKNPEKAAAYLMRAMYSLDCEDFKPPVPPGDDLKKAIELAPKDPKIRLVAAAMAKTPDEARGHLRTAIDDNPGDWHLYLALARLEAKNGNRDEAVARLSQGVARFPGKEELLFEMADLTLRTRNLPEAERVLREIERWKYGPERVAVLRSRLLMAKGEWETARVQLERLRPTLSTDPALTADVDILLGRCYEQRGKPDLARDAYRRARDKDPTRRETFVSEARILVESGKLDEAVNLYKPLAEAKDAALDVRLMYARLRTLEYLSTPVAGRPLVETERLLTLLGKQIETADDQKLPGSTEFLLLQVEVLSANEKRWPEAEANLRGVLTRSVVSQVASGVSLGLMKSEPESTADPRADIRLPLARLLYQHGKKADAWAELDELDGWTRQSGPLLDSVLTRLELRTALPTKRTGASVPVKDRVIPVEVREAFQRAAREYKPTYSTEDRVRLATGLAQAHSQWDDFPGTRQWWQQVATLRPSDISIWLKLFELAVRADDRGQMEEMVRKIHQVEGGPGAVGHYAEALLRIARPGDRSLEGFREAREHLDAAARLQPKWATVLATRAFLAGLEKKTPDEILTDYLTAIELGERRSGIILKAVELLCERGSVGDFTQADALLQQFRKRADSTPLFNKVAAEVSLFNNQLAEAADLALDAVANDSKQYKEYLWQARILVATGRSDDLPKAVAALERAIAAAELTEDVKTQGELWVALVQLSARIGPREAQEALKKVSESVVKTHGALWVALVQLSARIGPQEAQEVLKKLSESLAKSKDLDRTLARCFEVLGQTEEAKDKYLAAVTARPVSGEALRQSFAFFDRTRDLKTAVPVLRDALKPEAALKDEDAAWARRALALALVSIDDPATFQEALRLLDQKENPDDLVAKARVLATRVGHRREAIQTLLRAKEQRPLKPDDLFFLGQMYADTGNWLEGRGAMVEALALDNKNAAHLRFFVDKLLQNGELVEAQSWLAQLQRIAPDDIIAARLRAKWQVKRGRVAEAASHLELAAQPLKGSKDPDADRARVRAIARVADQLGGERPVDGESIAGEVLYPLAEKLYRAAVKGGTTKDELALAGFLARRDLDKDRGKVQEAITLCQRSEANPIEVATTLVAAAYGYCPTPLSVPHLEMLEKEVKACLSRAKSSPACAELAGLMHARLGHYKDAVQEFRTVVQANDKNAAALNNLAYMMLLDMLLAKNLRKQEVDAVLEKAWAISGPTAGLLDTRGMLYLASGQTAEAVTDLEQAVEQNPSSAKCLHLASAYHLVGGRAKEAWYQFERARVLQTDGSLELPAERDRFEGMKSKILPPKE